MNILIDKVRSEFRKYRVHFFMAVATLLTLYSLDLLLKDEIVMAMNSEDGLMEYLTVLCFFLTAVIFMFVFFRTRKVIYLLFALLFIFGTGEEISWGQRLFNFQVPARIDEINVQHEFNLHNLKAFSSYDSSGIKQGISRYISISAFYLVFCFTYGIILPAFLMRIAFVRKIVDWMHFPVPPLLLGILFLVNYLIFKSIGHVDVMENTTLHFHSIIDETFELGSGVIFLLISLSFLESVKNPRKKIKVSDHPA